MFRDNGKTDENYSHILFLETGMERTHYFLFISLNYYIENTSIRTLSKKEYKK